MYMYMYIVCVAMIVGAWSMAVVPWHLTKHYYWQENEPFPD